MKFFHKIPLWGLFAALLLISALVFRFALRGYSYIAHTLTFIAALIVMKHFFSRALWRVVVILVCIGLIYFIIVEIPIIKNARTDPEPERDYLVVLGAAVHGMLPPCLWCTGSRAHWNISKSIRTLLPLSAEARAPVRT